MDITQQASGYSEEELALVPLELSLTKACPYCAEEIKAAAINDDDMVIKCCRHGGEDQNKTPRKAVAPSPRPTTAPTPTSTRGTGVLQFQRKTGMVGLLVKIKVFIDGELKAELAVGVGAQLPVPVGQHQIEVKGAGSFRGDKTTVSVRANTTVAYSVRYTLTSCLKLELAQPAFASPDAAVSKATTKELYNGEDLILKNDGVSPKALIKGASRLFDLLDD